MNVENSWAYFAAADSAFAARLGLGDFNEAFLPDLWCAQYMRSLNI